MLFDEDNYIKEGQQIVTKIEENVRLLKAEYQKSLNDFQQLKTGEPEIFDELELKYLQLLSKLKKAIDETTNLWDRALANVEKFKMQKRIKAEYFLAGIFWTIERLELEKDKKDELIDVAKKLIA